MADYAHLSPCAFWCFFYRDMAIHGHYEPLQKREIVKINPAELFDKIPREHLELVRREYKTVTGAKRAISKLLGFIEREAVRAEREEL